MSATSKAFFRTERRRTLLVVAVAIVALGVQLPGVPLGPRDDGADELRIDMAAAETAGADPAVIWRTFGPDDGATPGVGAWVCAATLQRGTGHTALTIRACTPQPLTPERRFGFGYDSLLIEADVPGSRAPRRARTARAWRARAQRHSRPMRAPCRRGTCG